MASERSTTNPQRPLRPTLASNRTACTPITPRVAGYAASPTGSTGSRSSATIRSEPSIHRAQQNGTPLSDVLGSTNVTPRSAARLSRPGSANASPKSEIAAPTTARPRLGKFASQDGSARNGGAVSPYEFVAAKPRRPLSLISGKSSMQSPLSRPVDFFGPGLHSPVEDMDKRFFHASDAPTDAPKQEPKKAQFFHADGKEDADGCSPASRSPVLSAVSSHVSAGPWPRPEYAAPPTRSPPLQSPALSSLSAASPFFAPVAARAARSPSPTQSKENIHLSYRKGASQIFGLRPAPSSDLNAPNRHSLSALDETEPLFEKHASTQLGVRRSDSPTFSSIDPPSAWQARRCSTIVDTPSASSLPSAEAKATPIPRATPLEDIPTIDTSLASRGILSRAESNLSPTKQVPDLAAEARRERKVLDLEISNSSLMAINASLEREVRRQKAELKRFRRLSRAGRFSFAPGERIRHIPDNLAALPEESEDGDYFDRSLEGDDLMSDDEESLASSSEPLGPSAEDRLAKDEKRLRLDLEQHRELLLQSQTMNQSIKRCMYATEDMIKEGNKALAYQVQAADVKLGGRVLGGEGEGQDIEVGGEMEHADHDETANGSLAAWTGFESRSLENSEAGDRDSGIEVDRPMKRGSIAGRPPGLVDLGRFGSFS